MLTLRLKLVHRRDSEDGFRQLDFDRSLGEGGEQDEDGGACLYTLKTGLMLVDQMMRCLGDHMRILPFGSREEASPECFPFGPSAQISGSGEEGG